MQQFMQSYHFTLFHKKKSIKLYWFFAFPKLFAYLILEVYESLRDFHCCRVKKLQIQSCSPDKTYYFANLISKLNFYKLIPYPMDNCFTGRCDLSHQTPEKDVLYIIPAGQDRRVHSPRGASYFLAA